MKTRLSLTGPLVVARDIAHAKIKERLDAGEPMPQYLRDHAVYYAGPAKTPEGYASGSFGPTTAGRMDSYVDQFQAAGGSMVMLAKGNRSAQVTHACKTHGGFYLGSIGGPAARLAQDCIKRVEVLEYAELGMEAVWKIEVEDFPAFIVVDDKGNDFFADTAGRPVALTGIRVSPPRRSDAPHADRARDRDSSRSGTSRGRPHLVQWHEHVGGDARPASVVAAHHRGVVRPGDVAPADVLPAAASAFLDRRAAARRDGTSYCEWKGTGALPRRGRPATGWRRGRPGPTRHPSPSFAVLPRPRRDLPRGDGLAARSTVDAVTPQPGGFYGGWVTPRVVGPFKGDPGHRWAR